MDTGAMECVPAPPAPALTTSAAEAASLDLDLAFYAQRRASHPHLHSLPHQTSLSLLSSSPSTPSSASASTSSLSSPEPSTSSASAPPPSQARVKAEVYAALPHLHAHTRAHPLSSAAAPPSASASTSSAASSLTATSTPATPASAYPPSYPPLPYPHLRSLSQTHSQLPPHHSPFPYGARRTSIDVVSLRPPHHPSHPVHSQSFSHPHPHHHLSHSRSHPHLQAHITSSGSSALLPPPPSLPGASHSTPTTTCIPALIPPGMDPAHVDMRTFLNYTPNQVKHRKRTTRAQLRVLEDVYKRDTKPNGALRKKLAGELGMTARGVQVWFQNRRAKTKNQLKKAASAGMASSSSGSASQNPDPSSATAHEGSPEADIDVDADTNADELDLSLDADSSLHPTPDDPVALSMGSRVRGREGSESCSSAASGETATPPQSHRAHISQQDQSGLPVHSFARDVAVRFTSPFGAPLDVDADGNASIGGGAGNSTTSSSSSTSTPTPPSFGVDLDLPPSLSRVHINHTPPSWYDEPNTPFSPDLYGQRRGSLPIIRTPSSSLSTGLSPFPSPSPPAAGHYSPSSHYAQYGSGSRLSGTMAVVPAGGHSAGFDPFMRRASIATTGGGPGDSHAGRLDTHPYAYLTSDPWVQQQDHSQQARQTQQHQFLHPSPRAIRHGPYPMHRHVPRAMQRSVTIAEGYPDSIHAFMPPRQVDAPIPGPLPVPGYSFGSPGPSAGSATPTYSPNGDASSNINGGADGSYDASNSNSHRGSVSSEAETDDSEFDHERAIRFRFSSIASVGGSESSWTSFHESDEGGAAKDAGGVDAAPERRGSCASSGQFLERFSELGVSNGRQQQSSPQNPYQHSHIPNIAEGSAQHGENSCEASGMDIMQHQQPPQTRSQSSELAYALQPPDSRTYETVADAGSMQYPLPAGFEYADPPPPEASTSVHLVSGGLGGSNSVGAEQYAWPQQPHHENAPKDGYASGGYDSPVYPEGYSMDPYEYTTIQQPREGGLGTVYEECGAVELSHMCIPTTEAIQLVGFGTAFGLSQQGLNGFQ